LFRILWWLSVAPLGKPVVPEVNWMLIASSNCSFGASSAMRAFSALPPAVATSSKFSMPGVFSGPSRMTCLRCGSFFAFTRSSTISR